MKVIFKKIVIQTLILLFFVKINPIHSFANFQMIPWYEVEWGPDITATLSKTNKLDDTLILSGTGPMTHFTDFNRPFFKNDGIRHLIVEDGITSIGDYAFHMNQLTSVMISDSVVYIGRHSFSENQIQEVYIGKNVNHIEEYAFHANQIYSVIIPNSVISIGNSAFAHNELRSLILPNGLTFIMDNVFADNQLSTLFIPNQVTAIGEFAFARNQIKSVSIKGDHVYIGGGAFTDNPIVKIEIGEGACIERDFEWSIGVGIEGIGIPQYGVHHTFGDYSIAGFSKLYKREMGRESGIYIYDGSKWVFQNKLTDSKVRNTVPFDFEPNHISDKQNDEIQDSVKKELVITVMLFLSIFLLLILKRLRMV